MLVPLRGGKGAVVFRVVYVLYSTFSSWGGAKWWVGDGGGGCACFGLRGAG
jgi:hypothetical protein